MTTLRKDAMDLLEQMPEDKLHFIIQIMQGVNGLYGSKRQGKKEQAFTNLESFRRKIPDIDYEKELEQHREDKYGNADIG